MKTALHFVIIVLFSLPIYAQVGIGTTSPNGELDITSTDDGLLIPRVALAATTTVTVITPTTSELVYNTATAGDVTPGFYYLSSPTGPWVRIDGSGASSGWSISGNADIVDGTNFLGTTNNIDVAFRRNNLGAGKIGTLNTSFGLGALSNVTTGDTNTAIGVNALNANTTAIQNTAVGYEALNSNNGLANTAYGFQAGFANGTADRSVAIGFQAMQNNTSSDNTALGFQAMQALSSPGSNFNVALGFQAMQNSNGSIPNPMVGNTFVGRHAGLNSSGDNNVGLGMAALGRGVNTGNNNIAIGVSALEDNTSGQENVIIGNFSTWRATTGVSNTVVGYTAGSDLTTGSNNVLIGRNAQPSAANASNEIVIGAGTAGTAYVNAPGWSFSSDRRLKDDIVDSELGLSFIEVIRPVSYYRKDDVDKKKEIGFIAQELDESLHQAGIVNSGIISKTSNGMLAVRYNELLPITIKAVQEQQALIEELQKNNEALKKINAEILRRLEALEKK